MKTIAKAWAVEYPNGKLMKSWSVATGAAIFATRKEALFVIDQLKSKGKPVKVRITVEKVI